jgi:hypothetical protein
MSKSGESKSVSGSERKSANSRRSEGAREKRRVALCPAIRTYRWRMIERILRRNGRKNIRSLTSRPAAGQSMMLLDPARSRS